MDNHPIPHAVSNANRPAQVLVAKGTGDDAAELWMDNAKQYSIFIPSYKGGPSLQVSFADRNKQQGMFIRGRHCGNREEQLHL